MQEIACRRFFRISLAMLILLGCVMPAAAAAREIVEARDYRGSIEACRQDFEMPNVHTLPMGVGDAPVKRCFNNGFETISPHTKRVGTCQIEIRKEDGSIFKDSFGNKITKVAEFYRHEFHCRFRGAGAVLGEATQGIRESGSRVYFRGEEPTNFETKDPGCKKILEELRRRTGTDKYYKLL